MNLSLCLDSFSLSYYTYILMRLDIKSPVVEWEDSANDFLDDISLFAISDFHSICFHAIYTYTKQLS